MALFDLLKFGSYNLFPDSYAVDRETLYRLFKPTLIQQLSRPKTVILSLHFPAEFFVVQDLLSQWDIDYKLITRPLDRQWFQENKSATSSQTGEVGYFLSFEDEVVTRLIDQRLLDLLLQMGANDHGLIASSMLSKRLRKMQKKALKTFSTQEQPADSVSQWYELNKSEK